MWTTAIKNIFVPFMPVDKTITTAAVDVAISMADQAEAHLTLRALSIQKVPPYSVMPAFTGALAAKINEDEKEALQAISAHLDNMLKTVSFPHDLAITQQPHAELVALASLQGRMHDLTVIDTPVDFISLQQSIFEELVFQSGRPVLVVPHGVSSFSAKRIVIAWDGSSRAARALSDAMPFLANAEHVELTTVVNEKKLHGTVPGADMARLLARHNIKVETVAVEMTEDAGTALMDRVEVVGADLIVAGAFAHSRWRHLILGGVTTSFLRESAVPVLMSH
ncbi:MAG: universal stress protein [Beijerinckiaceae bacterium]